MVGKSWSYANDRRVIELAKASKSLEEAVRIMKRTPERIRGRASNAVMRSSTTSACRYTSTLVERRSTPAMGWIGLKAFPDRRRAGYSRDMFLSGDEARRIALAISRLPDLLRRPQY